MKKTMTYPGIVIVIAAVAMIFAIRGGHRLAGPGLTLTSSPEKAPPAQPRGRRPAPAIGSTTAPKAEPTVDGRLGRAIALERKVLPSRQELEALRQAWATPELIAAATETLLDTSPSARGPQAQLKRMEQIEFLDAALSWKENPRRQTVVRSILTVLERDVAALELPVELKRSLAGDAVELYGVLLQGDAERAKDLFGRSSNEQQKLFSFATSLVKDGHYHVE